MLGGGDKPANVECSDGVCNIVNTSDSKSSNSSNIGGIVNPLKGLEEQVASSSNVDNNASVDELVKMGWKKAEATDALTKSNNDVTLAANMLEEQQEKDDQTLKLINELTSIGWSNEASESAIKECDGNVTEAISLLEKEEKVMVDEFQNAVKGMVDNGWEEVVARQALMAQWTIDQRKTLGVNTTIDPEIMASIRPTLKKASEEKTFEKKEGKSGAAAVSKQKTGSQPKAAKKEECVFDITAANFQKLVIESPVPVILDVYADWCGPCKQLGPILESAAMKSGGMFRVCKVNSDNERAIAELLEVQGLPTVYALKSGSMTDKFVGMLPQDQLQNFIVRLITNYGEKVQPENSDDKTLADVSMKVKNYAGMSALDFKKREKLKSLVDDALLNSEGGIQADFTVPDSVITALKYIKNVGKDINNKTFRVIKTGEGSTYREKVGSNACAVRLLEITGFKSINGSSDSIELQHYNSAVITLVLQRVTDTMQKKKFEKINSIEISVDSKSMRRPTKDAKAKAPPPVGRASSSAATAAAVKPKPVAKVAETAKPKIISSSSDSVSSRSSSSGASKKKSISRKVASTPTVISKKKKHVEYFGGDSTVTLAGEDDEEEDEDEEERNN